MSIKYQEIKELGIINKESNYFKSFNKPSNHSSLTFCLNSLFTFFNYASFFISRSSAAKRLKTKENEETL